MQAAKGSPGIFRPRKAPGTEKTGEAELPGISKRSLNAWQGPRVAVTFLQRPIAPERNP
jgi:hypothetical protein